MSPWYVVGKAAAPVQAPVEEVEGIFAPAKWGFWVGFFPARTKGLKKTGKGFTLDFSQRRVKNTLDSYKYKYIYIYIA